MCLIIASIKGEYIRPADLHEGFRGNPHGAGYMFTQGGKVIIRKPYWRIDKLIEDYKVDWPIMDGPHVFHFRLATHGATDGLNCHPFRLRGGQGICHNGMLAGKGDDERSDTRHLVEEVLDRLPTDWPAIDGLRALVDAYARGQASKFVLLGSDGVQIFNGAAGHWIDGGIWRSDKPWRRIGFFNRGSLLDVDAPPILEEDGTVAVVGGLTEAEEIELAELEEIISERGLTEEEEGRWWALVDRADDMREEDCLPF